MEPRILVLMALASVAIAGPIAVRETNQCATKCTSSNKLRYAPGTTYSYDYKVAFDTSISGASEDSAKLTLTSMVEIEVLGPCEMALNLRDTRLFHSDTSGGLKAADREDSYRRALQASPLRFSYQDGFIEHVCSGTREEPWVMNVKKGVLSAFQNNMDDFRKNQNVTETDVTGTCETQYKIYSRGYYSDTVKKSKDILTCTDRHDYRTLLQMVPYNVPSELQSIPLMKTTHECTQVVERGGVLQSTTCTEMHVYRPFSSDQSGGATSVKQTLTYRANKRRISTRQDVIYSRDTLLFDHSATRPSSEQARHQAEQKLKEICETTAYDVRPESPRLFSELVTALKALDNQNLGEIRLQLKTNSLCPNNNKAMKSFMDALPMLRTGSSVSLMSSLIINNEVPELQAKAWIASLAFIQVPSSEMLLDAKRLVDNEEYREDSLLPVSAMVNNFCFRSTACDQSYAVLSIMASLERNIPRNCHVNNKNFYGTLLTLRAIGNAGHADRAVPVITKCLTNTNNPLEIRVAAASAFRRMPCNAENVELWNTYENTALEAELRVAAYRSLMRCPIPQVLSRMAESLNREEFGEQVGAYVYSHLTNLRQTSDPHKQEVARSMHHLVIPNKYEASPFNKASTNVELSALINKINTGYVAEGDLLWTNNGEVPRAASANLTVELFGQSINLLEFGGRVEGLEELVKQAIGPYPNSGKAKKDLHGSVYGRIFGNEMFFMHSKQLESEQKKFSFNWLDVLIALSKEKEFSYTHSAQILDASMIIPSVAGLPINIEVNGSVVVDLILKGKADLRRLSSAPRSMNIEGEIRPSGALEITGTMAVDAFVTKTGLRMRNTLHSSTSLKGRMVMERGESLDIELDSPHDKMEIFGARSQFFILHDNVEKEQKMITENRKEFELCTSEKMSDITGAQLCGHISFPNASMQTTGPYFPLTGPSSISLVLRKTDTHSGYKLVAKKVSDKKSITTQISFNTPRSTVNRLISIDMSVDFRRRSVTANVVTPWKKADFGGYTIDTADLKTLSGTLTVDNSDVYSLTSEVKISRSKKQLHMSPLVEIRRPGADIVKLTGTVIKTGGKALDVDLKLAGLQNLPYTLKTSLSNGKKEKSLKTIVSADGGKNEYTVEAISLYNYVDKKFDVLNVRKALTITTPKRQLVFMDASADYRQGKSLKLNGTLDIHKVTKKPASISVNLNKIDKKRGPVYKFESNIKSSLFSGSIDSSLNTKKSNYGFSTKTTLDYSIPKVAKNRILFSGKLTDKSTKTYTKLVSKGNVIVKKSPEYNMAINFDFDHKKKHSEAELTVKYGADHKDRTKKVYLNAVLNKKKLKFEDVDLHYKIKAEVPEKDIDTVISGKHIHNPTTLDSDVGLTYAKRKNLKAEIYLKDKSKNKAKIHGHATVAWPGAEYVLSSKLDQESDKHYTHELILKNDAGLKHSMNTIYRIPNSKKHNVETKIHLQGYRRLRLSGSTNLDKETPSASGEVQYGKDVYGLKTKAKLLKKSGEVVVEMSHPDRRMNMRVAGEKHKHQYDGSIETSWDADKDESKKVTLSGSVFNKKSKNAVSLGCELSLTSPFERFENLATVVKYGSDRNQRDMYGKVNWGNKKHISTTLTLQKPVSLSHFIATMETKTPFKKMNTVAGEISHTWDKSLNTVVKGYMDKESAKFTLQGEGNPENFNGEATFSSTIKNAEDISTTVSHISSPNTKKSNIVLKHNSKTYELDLDMDHEMRGWHISTNGKLTLNAPKAELVTSWEHKNGKKHIKSKLFNKWNNEKLNVHLTGSHDLSSHRHIKGEFQIESSVKHIKDIVVSLNHKQGDDFIKSKAEMTKNGKTKALSDVRYSRGNGNADLDFTIISPLHNDLNGKFNVKAEVYPLTSYGELQWHPRKKVTVTTSLNAEKWDDADFDVTLTTPVRGYRNMNFRASNKREGNEIVSHANFDYGARKSIDLEARHALNEKNKMARVKLTTPFEMIKSLDTGIRFDGKANDFESGADFELKPHIGKLQGSAKWSYVDDDIVGILRLDTPYPEYPYYELSASSKAKHKLRKSHIEVTLNPNRVYIFDATHSFDLPISFDATFNSPHPEYDNLRLLFQHNHSPSSIASHTELRYQADKTIEGDLNADWSKNIEGVLAINTPFTDYESNRIVVRHQGDLKDFSSHGEINVAQKSVVADASFKKGYTSTGELSLSSPIPGMEKIQINIMKKGKAKNFKGEVKLIVNDDKSEIDYHHKLNKEGLKSSFSLRSPHTEHIKLSFNHKGDITDFTNDISAHYGRKYQIDSDATFGLSPQLKGDGTIKYKFGGGRKNTAKLSFNIDGALNDMSYRGNAGLNDDEVSVSGLWKTVEGLDATVEVGTPFKGFENTKIEAHGNLDKNFKNINAKVYLSTSVNDFGTGEFSVSKTGNLDALVVDGSILRNNVEFANIIVTNKKSEKEIHSTFTSRGSDVPEIVASFDHTGDLDAFDTKAKARVDQKDMFEGEVSFEKNDDNVNADAMINYNIEALGSNGVSLHFEKQGQLDDITIKMYGDHDNKRINIEGSLKLKEELAGAVTINTPFESYMDIGMSFKHNVGPENFNSEGQFTIFDGQQYSATIEVSRKEVFDLIEGTIEVRTPIKDNELTKLEFRHEGQMSDIKSFASIEYGDARKISYDLTSSTTPKIDVQVSIKTPFENYKDVMASAFIETTWPQLSITSNINSGEGRLATLRGSLDASKGISGEIALSTPIEGFTNVGLSFEHSGKLKNFKSTGRITYMDENEISGKVIFKHHNPHFFVELKTPFEGHKHAKCELKRTTTDSGSRITTFVKFCHGKILSTDTIITLEPRPGFDVTINTPLERYNELKMSASVDNSWPRLGLNSKASAGSDREFSLDASLDASSGASGAVDIRTPLNDFNRIGLSFDHSGNTEKFDSEGSVTYMDGKHINGKVSFSIDEWRGIIGTAELNTPFDFAKKTKAEITFDTIAPSYSAGYSFNYEDDKATSAIAKLNVYSVDNVDGSLEVVLPIKGVEYTKAEYEHRIDSSRIDGSMSLLYGDSKVINGELKASKQPFYDATLTVKTPFAGYELTQGTATYENSDKKYGASSSLRLSNNDFFSITSDLDLSAEPFRSSVQINTPFEDYRKMELVLTHEGTIMDFRSTGFLSSPITENVYAATSLKYNTPFDMEASASIKSNFEGVDDLLAEIKNTNTGDEMKTHTVIGWTSGKQILVDALVSETETWYKKKLSGELSLSTPFPEIESLFVEAKHTDKREKYTHMAIVKLNGEKLLDVDTEYSSKNKHQASVTFKKPLPMKYTVAASSEAGVTEAELMANWNRNEVDSNILLTASVNDQSDSYKTERSVDIGLEHASRKMGLVHKLSSSDPVTSSSGKIYWDSDESSKLSYDMEIKDSRRRAKELREGHFNIGLPSRTVGVSGFYSDDKVTKSSGTTISWDTDRSDSQIGLKGTITRGDRIKGDLILSLPAIRKEIEMNGEMAVQNGRIILDARTDISYSKDSRKTLTLTSKLEDISDYYSRYNYSLAVGVSHPYTNVDIQMTSHLGSSDEKMTIGLNTEYMTSRRQNKNLGLLAEINKLKRQISLQTVNPISKVEIVGDVVSDHPYKVRMVSKIDDIEKFSSDVTLDEDKKYLELNIMEGRDGVKLWAGYPEDTVFRSEISRVRFGRETQEALLAVRLNTSRLLHTRLHWETDMAQRVMETIRETYMAGAFAGKELMQEVNQAVSGEIAGKYRDITNAFNEEVRPLVEELDNALTDVVKEMHKIMRKIKKTDIKDSYTDTLERIAKLIHKFKKNSKEVINSLNEGLDAMLNFPIQQRYDEMISTNSQWLEKEMQKTLTYLGELLTMTEATLAEYRDNIINAQEKYSYNANNSTYMTYISDYVNGIDMTSYIPSYITKLEIPDRYADAFYDTTDAVRERVGLVLDTPALKPVKSGLNEVYQQSVWAYNFWELEQNIYKNSQNILSLIAEIVDEEIRLYLKEIEEYYHPVMLWEPEQGEVQAQFKLPVDVKRLDETPDLRPLTNEIVAYLPDAQTLEKVSGYMPQVWSSEQIESGEDIEDLKTYHPNKQYRYRKHRKGRKHHRRQ